MRVLLLPVLIAALPGCATRAPSPAQAIQVLVEADDPRWSGPLECAATNSAGRWPFTAPGSVAVQPSSSPLQITCATPVGARAEPSTTAPRVSEAARESARKGAATGAKVGAGAGVALGVAAASLMGPAFAVVLAAGSAFKGAQVGGVVGAMSSGDRLQYPSPIVLRITTSR